MVEEGEFLAEYFVGREFLQKKEERRCWNRGEENWRRGLTPEKELHSSKGSCYRVYWHVGSGARKPVSFLGPAGSTLVGRVDHLDWHQGSDEAQTREKKGYKSRIQEQD